MGWGSLTGDAFWSAFRERYGMHEAPFDNGGLPLGVRADSSNSISFDCLLCHAGTVAGEVVIGVANSMLDLQGLHDDVAYMAGLGGLTPPFILTNKTGAAGVTDAFGLGMELAGVPGHYGFQRPSAWWTIKHKERLYSDGSGSVSGKGFRLMMATLLAFGLTPVAMEAMDDDFEDILHYLISLPAPEWWGPAIDEEAVKRGKVVYQTTCRGCHGGNSTGFPEIYPDLTLLGTDPLRAENFTSGTASLITNSWFGDFGNTPMIARGTYMAPPLVGIWARAPYFHNGSVPTLRAVLDSSTRPQFWKRTGSAADDFDFVNVGWKYTEPTDGGDRATIEGRKTYDTTQGGLSNAGHTYGDSLTSQQRDDVIEYLKTF